MNPYIYLNSQQNYPRRTICVMGSARGGTTMIAGLISRLGVSMGEDIAPATEEDREFRSLVRPLEITLDKKSVGHEDKIRKIYEFIDEKNSRLQRWGWKDPESMTYIDLIKDKLINPSYVIVYRDPLAITQKELNTGLYGNPVEVLDLIVNHRYKLISNFIEHCDAPIMLVSYERALRDKKELIKGLSEFLGVESTDEELDDLTNYIQPNKHPRLIKD